MLAGLEGDVDVTASVVDRRVKEHDMFIDVFGNAALTAGVLIRPLPGLRIGFTYRQDLKLDYNLPITFDFEEVGFIVIGLSGISLNTPHEFNLGLSYDFQHFPLRVALDLTYALWSEAPSPAVHISAFLDDSGLNPDLEEPNYLLQFDTSDVALAAQDILITHIGLEYTLSQYFMVRMGYFFRPTPIPDQVGYSNFIDNDAHVISLGGTLTVEDPLEAHENPVSFDVFFQLTYLVGRTMDKDSDRDYVGVGSYQAGGVILNMGLDFRHDF